MGLGEFAVGRWLASSDERGLPVEGDVSLVMSVGDEDLEEPAP